MKEAFYCLTVICLGLFGLVLVNLFGDITVTNQQDYTSIKNSVEAAMYDSIDQTALKKGFCLCTNVYKTNGKYVFKSKDEYKIVTLTGTQTTCSGITGYRTCELLKGESKLNEELFIENFLKRFAYNVKSTKDYKITIKEIIEYPPKVSVIVSAASTTNVLDINMDDTSFDIVNNVDAILESER